MIERNQKFTPSVQLQIFSLLKTTQRIEIFLKFCQDTVFKQLCPVRFQFFLACLDPYLDNSQDEGHLVSHDASYDYTGVVPGVEEGPAVAMVIKRSAPVRVVFASAGTVSNGALHTPVVGSKSVRASRGDAQVLREFLEEASVVSSNVPQMMWTALKSFLRWVLAS